MLALLDGVRPGQHVLEIGCGGRAGRAHRRGRRACHRTDPVAGAVAPRHRAAAQAGLDRGAELRLQDYRDADGCFDRIVSIEMVEAVGEAYWPTYFAALRARLAPGGIAVSQVITIADDWFETYRRGTDFIQRAVFPAGCCPRRGRSPRLRTPRTVRGAEGFGDKLRAHPAAGGRGSAAVVRIVRTASRRGSAGCGITTWRIARPASAPAAWTWGCARSRADAGRRAVLAAAAAAFVPSTFVPLRPPVGGVPRAGALRFRLMREGAGHSAPIRCCSTPRRTGSRSPSRWRSRCASR